MHFATNLRILRKQKGLTQRELAAEFGVSTGTIGFYETGAREPNLDMLVRMADFFDVSADQLIRQDLSDGQPERKNEMHLASNLRTLRKQSGLDQAELGKAIGISQKSVSKYENGDRQPTYKTLIRMAEFFNVSLNQLVLLDLSGEDWPE